MKRLISLLLAAMLVLGVIAFTVSCGSQVETESSVTTQTTATEKQTTSTTATETTAEVTTKATTVETTTEATTVQTTTEATTVQTTTEAPVTETTVTETTVTETTVTETTATETTVTETTVTEATTTEAPVTETTVTEATTTEAPVTETTVTETTVTETTVTETTVTETTVTETTVTETTATETTVTEATTTATTPEETTTNGGTEPPVQGTKMPGYEHVDFGGRTFYIASSTHDPENYNNDYADFWSEGYNGDAINDAVYERNKLIEKLYNCTIAVTEGSEDFSADVATGGGKYIGYSTAYSVGSRASSSYYNVLKFDIDYTQPYFDQAFIRDLSCHNKLFSIAGSWSLAAKEVAWIIFMNKTIYDSKFSDVDIYQLVRDHKWTYDKMSEFVSAAKQDINGDSKYTFSEGADADIVGLITTTHNNYALYYCGGLRIVDKDANGNMVSVINSNPNAIDILTEAKKLFDNEGYVSEGYTNVRLAMQNNTTLFAGETMDVLNRMKDVEDLRVSVLPEPLYSEEQTEYYHYVNNQAPFLGFTTAFNNLEQLSNFLAIFAYHSYQIVYPAFIDTYKYVYTSDEESAEMLELIFNSLTYDPGYHLNLALGWISAVDSMLQKGADKYASYAKKYEKEINANIATFEDKVDKVDDSY